MSVLNSACGGDGAGPLSPEELSRHLQRAMLQLKSEHMDPDGRGVDYAQLRFSKHFTEYVNISSQLVNCDPTQLSEESRMAFFISILLFVCTIFMG